MTERFMKDEGDWKLLIIRPDGETEEQTVKGYSRACQEARNERFRANRKDTKARTRIIIAREF